jgi:GntR family transcriptional regulator, transcriptional repressor for pyruvate dehydrogenase complex
LPGPAETPTARISCGLYNDILAGILMGDYPPLSTLPTEARFARDYGISRSVVRSALDLLKREGVVRSRQGSGTIVASFDPLKMAKLNRDLQMPELKDCIVCRLAIEPEIAAIVAQSWSGSAGKFLEEQRVALQCGDVGNEYERSIQDAHFHIQLAEFSGNSFFATIMHSLRPHMLFAMNITKTLSNSAQCTHANLSRQEHLKIIAAILDRDATLARSAMRNHMESGRRRIFQESPAEIDVAQTSASFAAVDCI